MKSSFFLALFISLTLTGCSEPAASNSSDTNSIAIINEAHGYSDLYTAERLEGLKSSGKPFAVFVGASWCPGCQRLTKEIHANQSMLPEGTAILTADFDSELELRRSYGVTVKHSAIYFDSEGNHVNTESGVYMSNFMAHLSGVNVSQ